MGGLHRLTSRLAGIGLSGAGAAAGGGGCDLCDDGNYYESVDVDKPQITRVSSIIEFVPA